MTHCEAVLQNPLLAVKNIVKFSPQIKLGSHIPANIAKKQLGDIVWNSSYKISIVRNPFDTAVSSYYWVRRFKNPENFSSEDFELFCISQGKKLQENLQQYLINNEDVIDFYIRYETFQEDIKKLEERFTELSGLGDIFTQIKAKGQYRPRNASTSELFSRAPKAKELITKMCRFELEKFQYQNP